ncbi:uncharacterized protein C630.12 [Ananas comosus]|uniref:Uncharacterized protein C630.12 n=1 Tax=Ananas comosus TaxID=4615 RepID=A0A6P5FWQ4_ANACO|nr:uncharacterized protein C630.12 [Ananas comosus]
MQSLWRLTLFLCCLWAATLLYGEMVAYWVPLSTCKWPRLTPSSSSSPSSSVKVAVVADPQLMDSTSLGLAPDSFALEVAQFYTDLYMRRAFHTSILPFKPDVVLFLGDYFDGGPYMSDDEWQESLSRFKHIFGVNEKRRDSDTPYYYLCGNHDIGYAAFHSQHPEVISRYENEFGSRNYHFSIGKVNFIVVDGQTLDGPKQGNQTSLSWNFIKNISNDIKSNPTVLLTHIPLYRPDNTHCGPYRSSPVINQRISYAAFDQGITYQNYLDKETSNLLLSSIKPILVLSGHDHDQCTVFHSTPFGSVLEHTLGTISWQQGNLYPSFMLMSVASRLLPNATEPENSVSTLLCFLPKQTHIYIWYICQFVLTLLLLIIWPTTGFGSWSYLDRFLDVIKAIGNNFGNTAKEKDDEENCDYEMIWDAEGSMHLVKKATSKAPNINSEAIKTGRGNVVARPTARKHMMEPGPSDYIEINTEARSDDAGKVPRFTKSKATRLVQRLIRVIRLLVVIAAVNVPLYMMLLFKDWIER